MTDLIDIVPGQEMDGSAAAYEGDIVHGSISALVAAVPALLEPGAAGELARHVNNFAQGVDFEPIMDPAAFARAYRARLAEEEPARPWQQEVFRLSDFGVPDLEAIRAPELVDGKLVFFARQVVSGLAYRVEAPLEALDKASYDPVAMVA